MSAKIVGQADFKRLLVEIPALLEQNVLRGAIRAFAEEVAVEARALCISSEVRATIKTTSRAEPGLVTARVQTKGKGAYKAPWLEHGTEPHFIAVDDAQRDGKTVRRINKDGDAEHALKINGEYVGGTIHHPGAKAHPFLRPALDHKASEAVAVMGRYVAERLTKAGLHTPPPPEDDKS